MERTENDNAILQRYPDRMVPGDFITGGSKFEDQEGNSGQSVTKPQHALRQNDRDEIVRRPRSDWPFCLTSNQE